MRSIGPALAALLAVVAIPFGHASAEPTTPVAVNPELVHFHHTFENARIIEIRPGVHVAFGYGLANFTFIETASGLIVVDSGWFASEMDAALADLRRITTKPVIAVIYTHAHPDHTGGAGRLGNLSGVPVYAPEGFGSSEWEESGRQFAPQLIRAYSQLGLMLESAGENPVGGGVGPAPRAGSRAYLAPDRFVESRQVLEIDGLAVELIPAAMDVRDGLMIWLPQSRVLLSGDTVTGVFTIVETPRFVPTRSPALMAQSFDMALALDPVAIVPGHGRVLGNRADAHRVLSANRDLAHFLIDQVDRRIEQGLGVEEIVNSIIIPSKLAGNPDLQPYYHRKEWMIRSLVTKRVGWYTELLDLIRPDGVEESRGLVMLAGAERLEGGFVAAMAKGDYRWAARIAAWLRTGRGGAEDDKHWRDALAAIAAHTDSVNERSYILSQLASQDGRIDWQQILRDQSLVFARNLRTRELVDLLRMRVDPESVGDPVAVRLRLSDTDEEFRLVLGNGTLMFAGPHDATDRTYTVLLTREELNRFYADGLEWNKFLRAAKYEQYPAGRSPEDRRK